MPESSEARYDTIRKMPLCHLTVAINDTVSSVAGPRATPPLADTSVTHKPRAVDRRLLDILSRSFLCILCIISSQQNDFDVRSVRYRRGGQRISDDQARKEVQVHPDEALRRQEGDRDGEEGGDELVRGFCEAVSGQQLPLRHIRFRVRAWRLGPAKRTRLRRLVRFYGGPRPPATY